MDSSAGLLRMKIGAGGAAGKANQSEAAPILKIK
jgi:hypothetical protein